MPDLLHLQVRQPVDGRHHLVEPLGELCQVGARRLGHHLREAGDLGFEALDLARFAHGPGEQFHDMAELRHLVGDLLDLRGIAALRLEFGLKLFEPTRKSGHRVREVVEARHRRCRHRLHRLRRRLIGGSHTRRRRGSHRLRARPNLLDGRLQHVVGVRDRFRFAAVVEPLDLPLHRPQCLAPAVVAVVIVSRHLVAQIAHPLGKTGKRRIAALLGVLAFNLIEQRDELAPQRLPVAGRRLYTVFGHGWGGESASHCRFQRDLPTFATCDMPSLSFSLRKTWLKSR